VLIHLLTLTVSQSKRLIARGLSKWQPIRERLERGMLVIAKGTTNRYLVEEILGEDLSVYPYCIGMVAPEEMKQKRDSAPDIPELVIADGRRIEVSLDEAIGMMSSGDIFVKGANALNYSEGVAGILSTGATGGTIGQALAKLIGSRIRLVIPVGLEKCVAWRIEEACNWLNSPEAQEGTPTMYAVRGEIFTEIEAIRVLTGAAAVHVSSGGVGGYEGSVGLAVKGSEESLRRTLELVEEISPEPPYEFGQAGSLPSRARRERNT